jgi:hypothetical protein
MAKKDKSGKGVKSGKIPKTIGGVKLSKGLRKSGEALIAKAQTPQGRQVIAAGLAMASAAVARAKMPPVPPRPAPDGTGTPVVDPAQIVDAVGQAATAFFDGLFGRKR